MCVCVTVRQCAPVYACVRALRARARACVPVSTCAMHASVAVDEHAPACLNHIQGPEQCSVHDGSQSRAQQHRRRGLCEDTMDMRRKHGTTFKLHVALVSQRTHTPQMPVCTILAHTHAHIQTRPSPHTHTFRPTYTSSQPAVPVGMWATGRPGWLTHSRSSLADSRVTTRAHPFSCASAR